MIPVPGWSAVGSVVHGPGGPITWSRDPTGATYLTIGFRDDLRDHPMLHQGMTGVQAFLRSPGVKGVAPLAEWDQAQCRFTYPVRDGVLLAAILERLRAQRRSAGPLAALELIATVAPILDDAARAGRKVGLPAHGALHPWRILLHPLGGATLVGHGLPSVEVNVWLDEETTEDPGPALRYFPPERIQEEDEDLRGDLYALAHVALELTLGRPLLDGPPDEWPDLILAGRPAEQTRHLETAELSELFAKALAVEPAARFASGRAFAERAAAIRRSTSGVSLFDLASALAEGNEDTLDEDTSVSYMVPGPGATPLADVDTTLPTIGLAEVGPARPPPRPAAPEEEEDATLVALRKAGARPRTVAPAPPAAEPAALRDARRLAEQRRPPTLAPFNPPTGEVERTDVIGVPLELIEAMTATDNHAAPPPIADLGPDPSLAAIQELARKIVDRTSDLAARALSLSARVQERSVGDPSQLPLIRAAQQGADRARRSADAARNAANLLALDEDASGALITLDLVRNAELQCEGALTEVQAQHRELERFAERVQAQARALHDAARRAAEHADRATDAANQADDLVTVLEQEQQETLLTAAGTADAVDLAIASAERAHASAEEARVQADQAARADRADLALRYAEQARRAEEGAVDALRETREAGERARKLEGSARESAGRRATDAAARARSAAEDAWRALQRADEALRLAATPESRRLRDECAGLVRDVEAAATEADRALQNARSTELAAEADRNADLVERAAGKGEESAQRAAAISDRVVRAAGAIAEARARLSKLQEEGKQLTERCRASLARSRDAVDALLDEVSRLPSDVLADERRELSSLLSSATDGVGALDAVAAELAASTDAAVVESSLSTLRRSSDRILTTLERIDTLTGTIRSNAETELKEQERREEARREIARSANQARDAARKCRELVDQATAVVGTIPPPLPGCKELDEVGRLRSRAVEIIDIAEFQAGEASSSAEVAGRERDPAEARAHAQTAHSFLDRISTDIPEAELLLHEAAGLARRENESLTSARARVAECEAAVQQIVLDARAAVAAAADEAAEWRGHRAVAPTLSSADDALRGFDEDLNETSWARDHASRALTAADAEEYVPRAETATARARDRRKRIDGLVEAVRKGIGTAEAASAAVLEARKNTRVALENCVADLSRVAGAQQRLKDAVTRHGGGRAPGNDLETANAELTLRELGARIRQLRQEIEGLAGKVEVTTDPEVARTLAARALEYKVESELLVERAAENEARGVAAAEQQARARAEAEHRRLTVAREAAAEHARRAREAVERIDQALDEAEDEGARTPSPPARARFEEAERLGETLRTVVTEVERIADEARSGEAADAVQQAAERASKLCATVVADASRVLVIIQEAMDLSRAAEAEATALNSVREEVRTMVATADEAVERAQKEAQRVRHLLVQSPRQEFRAMQEAATSAVQTASNGAAKVRAALPLAEQASSLAIAEATLRAARQALDRAVGAADQVRQLVARGTELLQKEKETQAAALAEARAKAAQPSQEAAAAASKAAAWAEAGRREWEEAGRPAPLENLLKVLERSVSEVRQKAGLAAEAARRTVDAPTEETARSLGRDVRQAVDATTETARHARAALDELREQIQQMKAEGESVVAMAAEAADHASAANQVADQAESTLIELEAAVDALGPPSDQVESALLTVRTCATNARFAAATASSLADSVKSARRRADAEQAVEEAHRALEDALDALERVVAAEATCRAAIQAHHVRQRDAIERAEQEQRRRTEDEARRRADEDRQRQQAEEEERRRRDDERRQRVERRREERISRPATGAFPKGTPAASTTPAPAADREALRSMLRQSRPAVPGPSEVPARPRRRGEAPAPLRRELPDLSSSRPDPDGETIAAKGGLSDSFRPANPDHEPTEDRPENTGRNVRSWSPSQSRPTRGDLSATSSRPRARPETAPTPTPKFSLPPANDDMTEPGGGPSLGTEGQKVDALLERLRARRSDKE